MAAAIRIGVSGWSYKSWLESFFPSDLPKRLHLEYLTRRFNTVEVNASFYRLQKPSTYQKWRGISPAGFVFAVKGSRFITHNLKMKDAGGALANFLASGILALGDELGPLLWQLPESLRFNPERVESFFRLLPGTTRSAAELASSHDHRVPEPFTKPGRNRRLRHALEVRHPSFYTPEFVNLARSHGIAIVFSDAPGWPLLEEVTADFIYARLHGSTQMYASRYTDEELDWWADRIRLWSQGEQAEDAVRVCDLHSPRRKGRDVFVYFDNDQEAHAPHDAIRLARRLGVG